MAVINYFLHGSDYFKLAKVLPKLSRRGNIFASPYSNEAAHLIDKTGALFYYDGKSLARIGANKIRDIRRTEFLLEEKADIKLTEIPNGRRR